MTTRIEPWLVVGGTLSLVAALLHLATIAGGPDWYRFMGAGEGMARAAARGDWRAAAITTGIALLLGIWAAYAFSGAGLIVRLPLLRLGLIAITAIYLVRGLFILAPGRFGRPDLSPGFIFWSSLIVLVLGLIHAIGLWRAWPHL